MLFCWDDDEQTKFWAFTIWNCHFDWRHFEGATYSEMGWGMDRRLKCWTIKVRHADKLPHCYSIFLKIGVGKFQDHFKLTSGHLKLIRPCQHYFRCVEENPRPDHGRSGVGVRGPHRS